MTIDLSSLVSRTLKAITVAMLFATLSGVSVSAHEVIPSIADMTDVDGTLAFSVEANIESFVADIDLSEVADTDASAEGPTYDSLRALDPAAMARTFETFWPEMASRITIRAGETLVVPEFESVEVPEVGDPSIGRRSVLRFRAALPDATETVQVGWAASLGTLVVRQMDVAEPYDGYLEGGALSDPIALEGGGQVGGWQSFVNYIPVGFDHIVPKGLDHILFVLGLFFLSTRLRPLLWQVSAFTVAHTITLALAALGYVSIPGSIVEPLIAASIVFIAVENVLSDGLSRWRPFVVFGFGLLHGLGFASVLADFGLPDDTFVPALLGFNVGVELGQLAVIVVAFALVGYWFESKPWYRRAIAIPASVFIGLVGVYWFVERVFL